MTRLLTSLLCAATIITTPAGAQEIPHEGKVGRLVEAIETAFETALDLEPGSVHLPIGQDLAYEYKDNPFQVLLVPEPDSGREVPFFTQFGARTILSITSSDPNATCVKTLRPILYQYEPPFQLHQWCAVIENTGTGNIPFGAQKDTYLAQLNRPAKFAGSVIYGCNEENNMPPVVATTICQ